MLIWPGRGVNGQNILEPGKEYTRAYYDSNNYITISFTASSKTNYTIPSNVTDFTIYPGTQSGFRDDAIWKGGIMNESDIWYSTWEGGIFKSNSTSNRGNAWGIIWKDGIVEYMNAYNVFWEGGVWRNGNWNGSPFTDVIKNNGNKIKEGFVGDIIRNISGYKGSDDIHLNNIFNANGSSEMVFRFPPLPSQTIPSTLVTTPPNSPQWEFISLPPQRWQSLALTIFQVGPIPISTFINTDNIFDTPNVVYSIKLDYQVANVGKVTIQNSDTIRFEVVIGNSNIDGGFNEIVEEVIPLTGIGLKTGISTPKSKTLTFIKQGTVHTSFRLRRIGSDGTQQIIILGLTIELSELVYDKVNNNKLYTTQLGELSDSIFVESLSSRYGNGEFTSGIWENGVWLEGWRDDKTVIWAENLSKFSGGKNKSYQVKPNTWNIELEILNRDLNPYSGNLDKYKIGDKVSVGNIVCIDLNGNRRLIRDYLTVIGLDVDSQILLLEVDINFPIRGIEKDSENHLIYISKNVWLNGVFLNGKFLNGVWNNGLFRGNLNITEMEDSHWIDGTLRGGLFRGFTSSYLNNLGNELINHKSVIQRFDFFDENISGEPFKFKYNSWVDVNYYETEGVNINRLNSVYKKTALGFTASFVENNFYGYPTIDVLESNSNIRNGFDLEVRSYRLGYKFKEFTNYLEGSGEFLDINQLQYNNTIPTTSSGFGIDNLLSVGWTFSYLSSNIDGFGSASNTIESNIGNLDTTWLYLSGGRVRVPFVTI
jgi:hypothetical protein